MKQEERVLKIVIDSREQQPLIFPATIEFSDGEWTVETKVGTLRTADYTLHGYEDQIAFERKKSIDEIAGNLFGRDREKRPMRERFQREMERLSAFETKAVLIIGSLDEIRAKQYRSFASPVALEASIDSIAEKWSIPIRWCETPEDAALYVLRAFRRFIIRQQKTETASSVLAA